MTLNLLIDFYHHNRKRVYSQALQHMLIRFSLAIYSHEPAGEIMRKNSTRHSNREYVLMIILFNIVLFDPLYDNLIYKRVTMKIMNNQSIHPVNIEKTILCIVYNL